MFDFIPFPQLVRQLELLADAHVLNATPIGAHVKDTMRASAAFVDANVLVYRCLRAEFNTMKADMESRHEAELTALRKEWHNTTPTHSPSSSGDASVSTDTPLKKKSKSRIVMSVTPTAAVLQQIVARLQANSNADGAEHHQSVGTVDPVELAGRLHVVDVFGSLKDLPAFKTWQKGDKDCCDKLVAWLYTRVPDFAPFRSPELDAHLSDFLEDRRRRHGDQKADDASKARMQLHMAAVDVAVTVATLPSIKDTLRFLTECSATCTTREWSERYGTKKTEIDSAIASLKANISKYEAEVSSNAAAPPAATVSAPPLNSPAPGVPAPATPVAAAAVAVAAATAPTMPAAPVAAAAPATPAPQSAPATRPSGAPMPKRTRQPKRKHDDVQAV